MPRSDCPTSAELTAFHLGDLPETVLDEIGAHLENCPRCEAAAQALDGVTDPRLDPFRRSAQTHAAAAEEPLPERVGDYEILGRVGRGGMGVVYRARHVTLHRTVALKMLLGGVFADRDERLRFRAEAEAVARLQHPHIVQLFDLGEHDAGTGVRRPYFTLEFVDGDSLAARLAGGPQPPRQAAAWLEPLARAVHYAHEHGIVHRDLKPSNVLLTRDGQPKVCDFGVAKLLQGGPGVSTSGLQTRSGTLVGTAEYMAPEQAEGKTAVGPAADVYALGALLYTMLTGRPPFQGASTLDTLDQVRTQDPVTVRRLQPTVPRDLETICLTCLRKEPHLRYASAEALADDLGRFRAGEPILARPVGPLERALKWVQRNPTVAALLAAILLVTLVAFGLVTWQWREALYQKGLANDERSRAVQQAYRARLAAATAALWVHDVGEAARQLDQTPPELRDWEWRHLSSRLDGSSAVRRDGTLLTNPDGLRLWAVTATDLRLTDEDGCDCLVVPRSLFRGLAAVGPERGGLWILDEDEQGTLRLLDEAGTIRLSADGTGKGGYRALAVSPDQARLAVSWRGGPEPFGFELYGTASSKPYAQCVGHTDRLNALAFSPDGARVASACEDGTARLWDTATGALTAVLRGHTVKVHHIAFRPDGERVLTTAADGTVRRWDARTGKEEIYPYQGHVGDVYAATYSPNGEWIASGGGDRTVRVWRAAGRQEVAALHGHTGAVRSLAYSPDGRRLASWGEDGTVRYWDVDPQASLPVLQGHTSYVYPVAYSPDGQWIASGSWDKTVRLWDAVTGQPCAVLPHTGFVRALAFSPDSSRLVSGCDGEDRLQIWDVATARRQKVIPGPGKVVHALTFSPNGTRIAAADRDSHLSVLDAATGQEIASLRRSGGLAREALAYSPDGRRLAGSGADHTISLWETHTNRLVATLAGHGGAVYSVAFSADGRRLVSASRDRTVRVWDVGTGACQAVFGGHTDDVFTAVFHPGGTRIASAGRDKSVRLWDADSGEEVARLQGHTNYVFSLAFSPDGRTLASGSGDGTVRLWDTEPVAQRYLARHEAEALRPEAERLAARLFAELREPVAVVARLRADETLRGPLRRAALRAVMRRGQGAEP